MTCIMGKLRHRLVIQQESQTADNAGGYILAWSTLATVFGYIKPVSGKERYFNDRLEASITHKAYIRYRSDVTAAMRISYDSRVFNIRSVINIDERDRYLELHLEEGVAT